MAQWLKDNARLLTAVVALYAAVLSTVAILQNRKRTKRCLVVKVHYGFLGYATTLSETQLIIAVANDSLCPVTVRSISLRLPSGLTALLPYIEGEFPLPHELAPGQGGNYWVSFAKLSKSLMEEGYKGQVKFRGVVCDAVGAEFLSKPLRFDIKG